MTIRLYSPRQMAEISGWPEKRIRDLLKEGQLKHIRRGVNYLLPEDAIDDFLSRNMFHPSREKEQTNEV